MIALHARATVGFTRLMIEKPFGRDLSSFDELNALTAHHFDESQLFRIDHYLGKEVLLNISTLRLALELGVGFGVGVGVGFGDGLRVVIMGGFGLGLGLGLGLGSG